MELSSAIVHNDLWENMEIYLDQLVEGYDSEEEFTNAFCEMAAYLLQKEYGENWREHAPPALLYYYDNVMQEEEQSDDDYCSPSGPLQV